MGNEEPMAISTGSARVPRGTKIVAKAFFAAAAEIPEAQRNEVIRAAFAMIRNQIKISREKVAVAKVKANGKAAMETAPKKIGRPKGSKNANAKIAPLAAKAGGVLAKRGRKAAAKRAPKEVRASITGVAAE